MRKALQYLLGGLILVSLTPEAAALFMQLNHPGLALPEGFNDDSRVAIQEILEKPESKFIAGSALNWTTTLNYGGNTESLSHFIHSLSKLDGTRISISFVKSLPDNGHWQVYHSATDHKGMKFHIRINLQAEELDMTKLVIPEICGKFENHPKESRPEAETESCF